MLIAMSIVIAFPARGYLFSVPSCLIVMPSREIP